MPPRRLRAALRTIDPAELAALEDKIALHREAIERRLSSEVEADGASVDDIVRERTRQVAKRAASAMAELADRTPRFANGLRTVSTPRWRRAGNDELQPTAG